MLLNGSSNNKIFIFTIDGGANVNDCIRKGNWSSIGCFAHKLNLAVTTYGVEKVPELEALITKCKKITLKFQYYGNIVAKRQAEMKEYYENYVESSDHFHVARVSPEDIAQTSLKS